MNFLPPARNDLPASTPTHTGLRFRAVSLLGFSWPNGLHPQGRLVVWSSAHRFKDGKTEDKKVAT